MSSITPSRRFVLTLLPSLLLAACSDNNDDKADFTDAAVIATRTSSYDGGAVSLVSVDAPYTAQNNLPPTGLSDIGVRSGGDHYFVIKRSGSNRILRFDAGAPNTPVYDYSTQLASEGDIDSNPYDLLIVSASKGYLLRYGSGKLWIVDPSAATEAGFKKGEIDLSAYDPDGIPNMSGAVLKDGKLYVALQRLVDADFFAVARASYVAVIDTATDAEVATGAGEAPLKGIKLPINNVSSLALIPGSSKILAFGPGDYGSAPTYTPPYDGGIVSINTSGYAASLLVEDGDRVLHPYGQIGDVVAVSSSRAYFIGSTGFAANQTLYRFDPGAATPAPVAVTGYGPLALGGLAVDPSGNLWVNRTGSAAPGVSILGFANNAETTVKDLVNTSLIPINVDFVTLPKP